jgi:putative acetyltransferase
VGDVVRIVEADTPELVARAAELFREYAAGLSFSLDYQGFEEELAALPGKYARPQGVLLLAVDGERAVGCAALRPLDQDSRGRICEMKRLYVRPAYRGTGLGRELAGRVVEEGRRLGYAVMRLDTSGDMAAAIRVYTSLGFGPIPRYNNDPLEDTLFFELVY